MPAPVDPDAPVASQVSSEKQGRVAHVYDATGAEISAGDLGGISAAHAVIRLDDGSWIGAPAADFTMDDEGG